ncbi:MAG: C1 family peptidase [bacterium]|nr:T9SS type A sorting domain-containing protein [candidate division KSB1 bacterium]MDH7560918.1 C1 family peptidase [bacterium]
MFLPLFLVASHAWAQELSALKRAIGERGAQWRAASNWVSELSFAEQQALCGTSLAPPDPTIATLLVLQRPAQLPPVFDWRTNNGNWVSGVRDQGACGSCWDFSAVAQIESWWMIHTQTLTPPVDLSEQFVLSCAGIGSCSGGDIGAVLEFARTTGIPPEKCMPYKADDKVPCAEACKDWRSQAVKIPGWGYITFEEALIANIKAAVYRHPVSAHFTVYEDFTAYAGGVYEHVSGKELGGHGILIVGWNDYEQSWICKNSWGPSWGDKGYFCIKRGNCGMGRYMPFIWDALTGGALAIAPARLELSLYPGDSTTATVTLSNLGATPLEYSAIDYQLPVMFHPSPFLAYDSSSWWCGDPAIKGYENHWLQYLETPPLNLSRTSAPRLRWMGMWAVEDPGGAEAPWDGWDGCNVWVSIDNGRTFRVAEPVSPPYDRRSLWSFGNAEQGWNMGVGIPGWTGKSGGWRPVEFDLAAYKADSVVIRFAFASDMGLCTLDDSTLVGFFVDEILVSDGQRTMFVDHGEDIETMRRVGFGVRSAGWLSLARPAGVIAPSSSVDLGVKVSAATLAPGDYPGLLTITTNDTTMPVAEVPLSLTVRRRPEPVVVEDWHLAQNYPNPFNAATTIEYAVPQAGEVSLTLINATGQAVRTLASGWHDVGYYRIVWDARDDWGKSLGSGVYLYRLQIGHRQVRCRKLVLLR